MKEILGKEEVMRGSLLLRNPIGRLFVRMMFRFTGMNRFNRSYHRVFESKGVECAHASLEDWGVKLNLIHGERLERLPKGAFVVVSNHPYGVLDGIAMLSIFGRERDLFMMIANDLLMRWEPMSTRFLPVHPKGVKKRTQSNAHNLKRIFEHLESGGSIGIFPAGDVSRLSSWRGISDIPWHPSAMKFISEARCPVVPIYFHGRNSLIFYLLGIVHKELRMLFSPRELYNKRAMINVTIGQSIEWTEMSQYASNAELSDFLRAKTYELKKNVSKSAV